MPNKITIWLKYHENFRSVQQNEGHFDKFLQR